MMPPTILFPERQRHARRHRDLLHSLRLMTGLAAGLLIAQRFAARGCWTRSRLHNHQMRMFRETVRWATAEIPFYRSLYRGIDLKGELAPSGLPVTNKHLLME